MKSFTAEDKTGRMENRRGEEQVEMGERNALKRAGGPWTLIVGESTERLS